MAALAAAAAVGACGVHGGLNQDPPDGGAPAVSCTDSVFIPEGAFTMGVDEPIPAWGVYYDGQTGPLCYWEGSSVWEGIEAPAHDVFVSGFWMQRFETTVRCYAQCVEAGACGYYADPLDLVPDDYLTRPEHQERPVTHTWRGDAERYCELRGGRLPTEAEWEKAARGPDGWSPTYADIDCEQADVGRTSGRCIDHIPEEEREEDLPLPVEARPGDESPYGVRGVLGGASEWVRDWFDAQYYQTGGPPWVDPRGPDVSPCPEWRGMLRGGAMKGSADSSPLTDRSGAYSCDEDDCWDWDVGIRCAWESAPEPRDGS